MLKIGIVGDLSLQDPARLEKAMAAAHVASDILIHVGDMHPGYNVILKYAAMRPPHTTFAVPGNHDCEWDTKLGWSRQWRIDLPQVTLIGLDNSQDTLIDADFAQLQTFLLDRPAFIVVHKPLSNIVLPDGTESNHCMGEGTHSAGAIRLSELVRAHCDILMIHGHFHGWSYMKTSYADCLTEGRGGAAPEIGWTQIIITSDGFTIHKVDLP